ncbi:ComEC/Rec2 family competence protein [Patescibacteria group bacterium]
MSRFLKILLIMTALAAGGAVLLYLARTNHMAYLNFCDVGQGDAIHIRIPPDKDFIVDTGPDQSVVKCLSKTMPLWDRTVEHLAITHFDADHSEGVKTIMQRYDVKNFYASQEIPEAIQRILKPDTKIIDWRAGQKLIIDQLELTAQWPPADYENEDVNAASLVLQGRYGGHSFLLTGDLAIEQEEMMIASHSLWPADILKVGHHGSKSSTGENLLTALRPEIAIISVGEKNRYGHPAEEALERLESIRVLRTDLDGTIQCDLNASELSCYPLAN